MRSIALFALVALLGPVVAESDAAFNSQFQKNLTTAAQGQIDGFNTAQALIQGNTTQWVKTAFERAPPYEAGAHRQFNNNNGGKGDSTVDQTSLTLDDSQVQVGSFQTGLFLPGSEAGEVASLTSRNNFINFCATQHLPLTNGLQFRQTGSCNPVPMGAIPDANHIPTTTIFNPVDGATLKSQSPINFQLRTTNMEVANFVNAQTQYYSAPQQLGQAGNIIGHTHITVSQINGLQDQSNIGATDFAFFLGINTPTFNGLLTGTTSHGLPAGTYRLCSLTAAANHQPVLVPIAQRVGQDDCVRFTVADNGDGKANLGDQDAANQNANFVAQAAATFAKQSTAVAEQSADKTSSDIDHSDSTKSKQDNSNSTARATMSHHTNTANARNRSHAQQQHKDMIHKPLKEMSGHHHNIKTNQQMTTHHRSIAANRSAAKRRARREDRYTRQARVVLSGGISNY